MGLHNHLFLPRLLAPTMQQKQLMPFRKRIGDAATGRVLELGVGSGLNLGFYGPHVASVVGVDRSASLMRLANARARELRFPVDFVLAPGEQLPIADQSVDTFVTTWTLCSVSDPFRMLLEARRVLRLSGVLLFAEHGRSPDAAVVCWQDRLTPTWRRLARGCHLNRQIDDLIKAAGFRISHLQTSYLPGLKPLTYTYEGRAHLW